MATKRRISVKVPPPPQEEGSKDERLKPVALRQDRGWRDWLLRDYLRYWYVIGCLMADVFIVLQVWQIVDPGLSISVPLIVLAFLALSEFLVFRALWGKDGRWKKA